MELLMFLMLMSWDLTPPTRPAVSCLAEGQSQVTAVTSHPPPAQLSAVKQRDSLR